MTGEYIGGNCGENSTVASLAALLIGRPALERERFYNRAEQSLRQMARLGLGVVNIALWDLAGNLDGRPIYQLLGGRSRRLPAYASTLAGNREPDGLNSPDAYARFAEACMKRGYLAFKIHPWPQASVREHVALVREVGAYAGTL